MSTHTRSWIICTCGHKCGRGAVMCGYCETPLIVNPNPDPRKPNETDAQYAKRCGPLIIEPITK